MKRVAYLGPPGTFTEEAAHHFFGDTTKIEYVPYKLISDVFLATANGTTDLSVIPVENTIDGSVSLHLDWLVHEVDLPIQAEWVYPIKQNLIGYMQQTDGAGKSAEGKVDFSYIKKIISHPVAIAQCREFLRRNLPDVEFGDASTAEGVRLVKEMNDPGVAAIGPAMAANLYDVEILARNIQDHNNNYTRFILIGKEAPELRESSCLKTTLLVTHPEDYPGALHQVLSAFAWRRINLTKIESRPTKKRLGSYYFYIDIEASLESILLAAAIEEIKAIGCHVRVMGSYPSYTTMKQ